MNLENCEFGCIFSKVASSQASAICIAIIIIICIQLFFCKKRKRKKKTYAYAQLAMLCNIYNCNIRLSEGFLLHYYQHQ